jgi:hypothetical protein
MKKILIYVFAVVSLFYYLGCVEDLTGANGDKIPPTVSVTSPKTNDTISFKGATVSYTASDDQGLSYFELYVDSTFWSTNHFDVDASGNNPVIKITLDSATWVGKRISYFIIAYDKGGNGTKSNTMYNIYVSTGPVIKAAPGAPQNLAVKKLSETIFNLSWDDTSSNVRTYEIWQKSGTSGTYQKVGDAPAGTRNYNVSGLNPNGNYFFKIRSYNEYGYSPWSNETSIGGGYGNGNVAPPTNLIVTPLGTKKVRITWQDNSNNETYFQIERRQTWETNYAIVGAVPTNINTFTDSSTALQANWEYYYRIKAYSSSNDSSWSVDAYVKTYPYEISKPTNLVAQNNDLSSIVLTWNDNDYNETQTNIERKVGNGNFEVYDSIMQSDIKTYTDNNIIIGVTYTYRVRQARPLSDYTIYSEYSNTASVTVTYPPNAPSNMTAVYLTLDKKVQLNWTDNSDNETNFIVERRDEAFSSVFIPLFPTNPIGANITGCFDNTIVSGRSYLYRVKAVMNGKSSSYSNEVRVTIP